MQRIKKGDTVVVIAGKDIGLQGEVVEVLTRENRVVVKGANAHVRHRKARQVGNQQIPAQIVKFDAPLHISNVMVLDPKTKQPTRVGFKIENGRKVRYAKKSGAILD
ncbi:MAG: 50S ribosomal protein L24 [Chloroflexi bacterium AL-W]|nr:50S ribosomal protein L24 [Chloroflexi bacterium AL-W]